MANWTITIPKKDVLFDMEMLSYGFSEVSGGAEVKRADRLALDTSSASTGRIVKRLILNRLADIKQLLIKFIPGADSGTITASSAISDGESGYTIELNEDKLTEVNKNILPPLAELVHEYVVNGALADYYSQMGAGVNIDTLNARCNADLTRIRELVYFKHYPASS